MKLKALLPIFALAATPAAFANSYQSFSSIDYIDMEFAGESEDVTFLRSQYFLDKKDTLGPLNEFDYINTVSNVYGQYANTDSANYWELGGDYFLGGLKIGASYSDVEDFNEKIFRLGYLFTDNFLVQVEAVDADDFDTEYWLSAQYTMQLKGKDYVGFTYSADDEFDHNSISAKYFRSLGGSRYLTTHVQLAESDGDNYWGAGVGYYFNKKTSLHVNYDEQDEYYAEFKHFFNNNFALTAGYGGNSDDSEEKAWKVGFSGQF